jgi:hypothetical protein
VRALAVLGLGLVLAAPAAAASPYPLLAERDGLRVYAPAKGQQWGRCPRAALPLNTRDLGTAERAALLAVPLLYARYPTPGLDVRGATARSERMGSSVNTRPGLARSTCGNRIAARTVVVHVGFPRVNWSASMSSATFFVAHVREGWILWHQAH